MQKRWKIQRLADRRSNALGPFIIQVSRQTDALEQHEGLIARHTQIQSRTNIIVAILGAISSVALIYIGYQQYKVSDRQVELEDRVVALEYAKVSPQFSVESDFFPTERSGAVTHQFPKNLQVRITRGEAALESVEVFQELELSLVSRVNGACRVRLINYFEQQPGNMTDFDGRRVFERVALNPSWFQDRSYSDFVVIEPQQTLVELGYRDIFDEAKVERFFGTDGIVSKIPSGDFPRSSYYETVDAELISDSITLPGSFRLIGDEPKTRSCRTILGLEGGEDTYSP